MSSFTRSRLGMKSSERWWLKVINLFTLFWMVSYAIAIHFVLSSKPTLEEIFGGSGAITPADVSPVLGFFMNRFWALMALLIAILAVVKEFARIPFRTRLFINLTGAVVLTAAMSGLVRLIFI